MYKLTVENHLGERLTLTQNPSYAVVDIDGLNPPKSNINMGENANFDGATFASSKMNTRQIVITVLPLNDVEKNRIALYQFFKSKKECTLYFENGSRSVYINGYVSAFECDLFATNGKGERAQITVLCPDPYFRSTNSGSVIFSTTIPRFIFEMDIAEEGVVFSELTDTAETQVVNQGDAETGMIIEMHATGNATNPTIYNVDTGTQMKLNLSMVEGDSVFINTNKGHKSILLVRGGAVTNILNALDLYTSTWLQLDSGVSNLTFVAESGEDNIECQIVYDTLFEGV